MPETVASPGQAASGDRGVAGGGLDAAAADAVLGARETDLPRHVVGVVQLGVEERLAAGEQRRRHPPFGVRPGHDVGEAEVAEGPPPGILAYSGPEPVG